VNRPLNSFTVIQLKSSEAPPISVSICDHVSDLLCLPFVYGLRGPLRVGELYGAELDVLTAPH
jgi:hypothetical protein